MSSRHAPLLLTTGLYPERDEPGPGKADRLSARIGGLFAPWVRPGPERFRWIIEAVRSHKASVAAMSDQEILQNSRELRPRLRLEGFREELVSRTFALVRETASRTLEMPHFDMQLLGGLVLLNGMVGEMETGEGKTLTATLAAAALALAGVWGRRGYSRHAPGRQAGCFRSRYHVLHQQGSYLRLSEG